MLMFYDITYKDIILILELSKNRTMKKIILSIFVLYFISNGFSQSTSVFSNNNKTEKFIGPKFNRFFPEEGNNWVLDSNFYYHPFYSNESLDWRSLDIISMIKRNENAYPLILVGLEYSFETNSYDTLGYDLYYYPDPNSCEEFTRIYKTNIDAPVPGPIINEYKVTYEIDENDYEIAYDARWRENTWQNRWKYKGSYTDINNSFHVNYRWDEDSEFWNPYDSSTVFTYESGLKKRNEKYYWRDDQWKLKARTQTEYNSNGDITTEFRCFFEDGIPRKLWKEVYTYDEQLNLIEFQEYNGRDSIWVNDRINKWNYDSNNFLVEFTKQKWNDELSLWEFISKVDYENDLSGNHLTQNTYHPLKDSNWIIYNIIERTFNEDNRETSYKKKFYNSDDSTWYYANYYTYSYQDSLLTSSNSYRYNDSLEVWVEIIRESIDYDNQGRLTQHLYERMDENWYPEWKKEYSYPETSHAKSKISTFANFDDGEWTYSEKEIDFWNKHITSITELITNDFKVFPNPCKNYLFIQSKDDTSYVQYEIINTNGSLLYSGFLSDNAMVNVNNLESGVYFIRLYKSDKQSKVLKFIKQ